MPKFIAPDTVAQQAIEWMVHLHSGEMSDEERSDFERWRAEHHSHDLACRRIEKALGNMPQVAAEPSLRKTLNNTGSRREFLTNALAITMLASTGGWFYNRHSPLTGLLADLHTATGERSTTRLADGSMLTLNARSSVDVKFDANRRHLYLTKGQIYIDAQPAQTPLVITTTHGEISMRSGAFTVSVRSDGTRVAALSQAAQISARNLSTQLLTGQGVLFNNQGIFPRQIAVHSESAWINGFIEVNDQPLGTLIEAFRDYRTGIVRVSPEAAKLRVSGVFPLDNTDYALEALAQTMPVVITRTSGYWISISKS